MSAFDKLHPSVQHHVVNSLEWRSLRPLQERAIDPVLSGKNCLLLAPTAGGKTEAAVLPILSRMLSEDWRGLSVLYVCPIRALLNNLEHRLSFYAGLVGRTCGLWHGDVAQAAKSKTLSEPPDILLTTPESLEALLISRRTDRFFFFGSVRSIIVDEIHAFAGDDRGWHLLAVLERIRHIAKRDMQRIGLSATIGNPEELLHWLTGSSSRESIIVAPPAAPPAEADVVIDFVGNLQNAAKVLKILHRGEKRLVFCDSRARTEELATLLRSEGVPTFVSHSSLSAEQRRDAETAFREARDCVIVATSTLELGIDVGDLDHVIQLDAPGTVSSFLQRLGRTGRRTSTRRNCLFLATSRAALLQASALVMLWHEGCVEPLAPPPQPFHVVAHQLMTLVLQQGGIGRNAWREWLLSLLAPMQLTEVDVEGVLAYMLSQQILVQDGGILGIGPEGERLYGGKNFMELLSVFDTPPVFTVFSGPRNLGSVHPLSFKRSDGEPAVLSLGGRAWQVTDLDFKHRTAYVVPSEYIGRSHWLGESQPLSYEMCQAVRRILLGGGSKGEWSKRAAAEIDQAREEANCVAQDALVVEVEKEKGRTVWWTFAGLLANSQLADMFTPCGSRTDNLSITLSETVPPVTFRRQLEVASAGVERSRLDQEDLVKFQECVPVELLTQMRENRSSDMRAVDACRRASMIFRKRCGVPS
ncbi:MAG: DEAD/DEAH box helicase [Terracidiphilus sp.]